MSHYSPQQIELKKRQALEKLRAKQNNSNSYLEPNQTATFNLSPKSTQINSYTANTSPKSIISFVNNQSSTSLKARDNVERILSNSNSKPSYQPYSKTKPTNGLEPNTFFPFTEKITGNSYLISEDRFTIEPSKYFEPLINIFKTIPSRRYDINTKLWNFHINDYDKLMNELKVLKPQVIIEIIPKCVLNCVRELDMNLNVDLSSIDPLLLDSLMPFQKEGVCFAIQKKGRCLIADEMGLGKTFQALAVASYYKEDWPLLIVTTSSMKNTWEDTIQKYLPSVPLYYVSHMQSSKDYINESKILVVSHDMMTRCTDKLLERNFKFLIIDESHTIKNFKSKCTQSALTLAKVAKRVILLSGTPALSRPSELFTQIKLLDIHGSFFRDFKAYSIRYCSGHETRFGWNATGQSNLGELEIILNKKFMIRRTKDQVLPDMPNKTRHIVKLNQELLKFTDEEIKNLNILAKNFKELKAGEKNAALLTFFCETAKLKVKAVCTYISDLLIEDKKCLIFVHHQIMMDNICQLLQSKKIRFIRIDGKTTSDQRTFFVDRFNNEPEYKCAVLSITATNAGITLTAANLVLFGELHWNPSILIQAESRAHRIGQENPVEVRYLIAAGTSDDYMWEMVQSKTDVLKAAGLCKDDFSTTSVVQQSTSHASCSFGSQKNSIDNYFSKSNNNSQSSKTNDEDMTDSMNVVCNVEDFGDDMFLDFSLNDEDDEALASMAIDV